MKEVTRLMINEFAIKERGIDFMGYELQEKDIYTFHHLIIPNRAGGPYARWNGAVLCGKSSHPYLHAIEDTDLDMFCYLTSEMIDINHKGYLDLSNLRCIHDLLEQFEKEFCGASNKHGKPLIKEVYTKRPKL